MSESPYSLKRTDSIVELDVLLVLAGDKGWYHGPNRSTSLSSKNEIKGLQSCLSWTNSEESPDKIPLIELEPI